LGACLLNPGASARNTRVFAGCLRILGGKAEETRVNLPHFFVVSALDIRVSIDPLLADWPNIWLPSLLSGS
jgi:hypothetical protein